MDASNTLSGPSADAPTPAPAAVSLERVKLVLKFKVLTAALYARKRLYALLAGRPRDGLMVNVGGGLFFRPHWQVLDHVSAYYPFARRFIDHDADLCSDDPFPFADGAVAFFYSAHTLEHIPQEHCPHVLAEMHRCLKPGGAVRLNMPDYDRMREAVARGEGDYFPCKIAKDLSFEEAVVEQIATERIGKVAPDVIRRDYHSLDAAAFAEHYTGAASRAVQKEMGGYHINWFNEAKLAAMLRQAGFGEVYRSAPQESRFAELRGKGGMLAIGDVLEIQRMIGLDCTYPDKSLYMEAVK
jgi:SAM-dependent methyltransferase